MRNVRAITCLRAVAGVAAALLAAAGCGSATSTATPTQHPSSERIIATPHTPASSHPGASGTAGAAPAPGCAGGGSVTAQTPGVPGGVPALDTVQFVTATRGWAAGAGRILGTGNGGATWTAQYAGPAKLYQVDFTDSGHGWAVGPSGVLATSDGGATWRSLPEPCELIDSLHFVSPAVGYAVAGAPSVRLDAGTPVALYGGRLMITRDGGRSWTALPGGPSDAQSVCFTSPSAGYLGTPGRVWRTSDGGAHWSPSFTEPPATGGSGGRPPDATALECAGPAAWTLFLGTGAAMGHAPYLAYTTPDGQNWHVLFGEPYTESALRPTVHAPDGPGTYPGPFSAISASSAAYVGWTPALGLGAAPLHLVTGAGLVKAGNVSGITQPYAAAFLSPTRGWVLGADQTSPSGTGSAVIESTTTGGRTWTRQYTLPAEP